MTTLGILSAKGGVGCSILATNLACSLTRYGTVALLDLHSGGGVDDLLLNLSGEHSWAELLPVASELKPRHFEIVRRVHSTGLELYAAPAQLGFESQEEDLAQCIQILNNRVDWLVLDLPAGFSLLVQLTTSLPFEMALVSTGDPLALRATKQLYDHLSEVIKDQTGLVLNQFTRRHPMKPRPLADAMGVDLFATLPLDVRAVGNQVNFGQPCVLDSRSGYGRAVSAFADRLQKRAKQRKDLRANRLKLREGD